MWEVTIKALENGTMETRSINRVEECSDVVRCVVVQKL